MGGKQPEVRPIILIDPAVRFGHPHIGGISTEAIAGMVMAGEPVHVTQDEYNLTRHQVLLACWWEGSGGTYQQQWKAWADRAHPMLGGWRQPFNLDEIPDPPVSAPTVLDSLGKTAPGGTQ